MTVPTTSDPSGDVERAKALESIRALSRRKKIVILLLMIARILIGFGFIVLMMSFVPKQEGDSVVYPVIMAIFGTVVYILFFRREIRGVYKSQYPTLRALEALILVAAMFLAIFSMIYVMISISDVGAFTEPLDSFTGYYFALTVLATVGFGDITPVTTLARSVTMVQMALDIAFIAVIIRVMGAAARHAIQMRAQREVEEEDRIADQEVREQESSDGGQQPVASVQVDTTGKEE